MTANLAHMSRNSSLKRSRAIAISKDECFNCHKMGHFGRDCKFPDYRTGKKRNSNNSSSIRQDQENYLPANPSLVGDREKSYLKLKPLPQHAQ